MTAPLVGSQSARGHQHPVNQDVIGSDPERRLWLVAGGMGGHRAGEVAAGVVRDRVLGEVALGRELTEAIGAAHRAVLEAAAADPERQGMGSTVVAVQLDDSAARIAWVGDSRAYLLRDGALRRVTRDHSLVQWLLEQNRISPTEAANHPDRNVLVRTLGFEQPTADLVTVPIEPDDVLLLCSDGLSGVLSEAEIRGILLAVPSPQQAADELIAAVVAREGRDDASVVVIRAPARAKLASGLWLPVAVGIAVGALVYLISNWMTSP